MNKFLLSFFVCALILFTACKKDKVAVVPNVPPPPPPPVETEIIETQPPILTAEKIRVNGIIGGFYSAVPFNYSKTTKKYPLLVFLHGAGQYGDGNFDLPTILYAGIPQLLEEKIFPANFKVGAENFSFIILAPQYSRAPANSDIKLFIDLAKKYYRVDTSRIYLSGLSVGGVITCDFAAEFPGDVAAIVPMAGTSYNDAGLDAKVTSLVNAKVPVWVFHNEGDDFVSSSIPKDYVTTYNKKNPTVAAKITLFPYPYHDAWTRACAASYKENNMNVYEWMLQYKK
jgi:predicted peptidase